MGGDGTSRVAAVRTVGVALANATPLQRVGRGSTENSPGGPQRGRVCGLECDPKKRISLCARAMLGCRSAGRGRLWILIHGTDRTGELGSGSRNLASPRGGGQDHDRDHSDR